MTQSYQNEDNQMDFNPHSKGFRLSQEVYERTLGSKKETMKQYDITQKEIDYATVEVLKRMTEPTGTQEDKDSHNDMLNRCVVGDKVAQENVKKKIEKIIVNDLALFPTGQKSAYLVDYIYRNNYGLGPIEDYVNDPTINEVFVNSFDHVWIEKGGMKTRVKSEFKSNEDVMRIIRLLLQFNHQEISIQDPAKESRMLNGERLTIMIPPVSIAPSINIRKFDAFEVDTENLLSVGTLTQEMIDMIQVLINGRANSMIIGETGAGKTSFLKWLIGLMNPKLRLLTLETNFELKINEKYPERNIVSYEEHLELGISMSDLFKKALRSSPDIIICGESRGSDADELLRSMRRGHPGSIGTMHTNSTETMVDDICEMVNEDGKTRDPKSLRYRVASSINIIYQLRRCDDGVRRLVKITEIIPNEEDLSYDLNDIFVYEQSKEDFKIGTFKKVGNLSAHTKKTLSYFGVPESKLNEL